MVARDVLGFRGAVTRIYREISDPLIIEALALRDAVSYAVEKDFGKIILEVDCSELVKHWHNVFVIKPLLKEISELSLSFSYFAVIFRIKAHSKLQLTRTRAPR